MSFGLYYYIFFKYYFFSLIILLYISFIRYASLITINIDSLQLEFSLHLIIAIIGS